jgi:protein-disulfide isomerase
MNRTILSALACVLLLTAICSQSFGEGLSREQGDAIVSELRQIRQLLERQQKRDAAPPAPAPPEKVRLKIGNEYALGSDKAPIVILEYTDYQCPFCSRFSSTTFPELKKKYIDTGKVRFISRDYPLTFHQHALKAAQATRCAGDQGKFWQMKDTLMKNHARLTPELITSLARDMSLDMTAFQSCMESGKHLTEIQAGIEVANSVGINGTPSFVIGTLSGETLTGFRVVGAQPLSEFEKVMKEIGSMEKN